MISDCNAICGALARLVQTFPDQARKLLADRYECPVLLVHGLREKLASRSSSTVQHHRDASFSKKFGEGLDLAFTVGVWDPDSACCLLACTKAPEEPKDIRPIIIRRHPQFAELIDVTREYMVDPVGKRIVPAGARWQIDMDGQTAKEILSEEKDKPAQTRKQAIG